MWRGDEGCGAWRSLGDTVSSLGDQFKKTRKHGNGDISLLGMTILRARQGLEYWVPRVSCSLLVLAKLRQTQLSLISKRSLTLPLTSCVILGKSLALSGPLHFSFMADLEDSWLRGRQESRWVVVLEPSLTEGLCKDSGKD